MKKKVFALVLTAALVAAQSVSVFAAPSSSSSSSSSSTTTSGTTSGSTTKTPDGQSLETNGAGSKTEDVNAEFAVGNASTSGLPEQVVSSINSINSGADLAAAIGNSDLAGYSALTKTAAVILTEKATNTVANKTVSVTLYIPNLVSGLQNVKILYFENATGQWKVVEPTAVDFANKTVSFNMFGSGTVTVIHK